ncbi:amidoligase family protein [Fodinibius halophilus]|uniref:Amidoligase n=1 Tax=Fodinibius halophilus TaxID=1736908 RepID=A0A6M1T685_9BACT|nr:amidoligase family protein [Fodinibius halophilus]NGP88143.1 amidoligase [Fodinibius halophilus]
MTYKLPPTQNNARGEYRKVGFELEFAGIEPQRAAEIITSLYGGAITKEHRYHYRIEGTSLGDFRVELDARILQKMAEHNILDRWGIKLEEDSLRKSIEDAIDKMARSVVPLEIVMPPLPVEELKQLETLRSRLQEDKAKGTHASFVNAFGMHINIESPDLEVSTLIDYLRSFMILYPWLLETLNIDISRRISPFVDPFPDKYVRKVLDPEYQPDQVQMVQDYIDRNPTRNRPIDMMPVFGLLEPELVKPVMEGEKNDPRPTFHYRLPNSRIDNPEWRFETEWKYWLEVEKLAEDKEMLKKLSRLYLLRKQETVISFKKEWAGTVIILLDLDE